MKSIIEDKDKVNKPFPKLMISIHGVLILAVREYKTTKELVAVTMNNTNSYPMGKEVVVNATSYEDFNGKVTLSND